VGRDFVSPDDVKAVAPYALAHRIVLANGVDTRASLRLVRDLVAAVAAPRP
jgi:MoxR-like ATPase